MIMERHNFNVSSTESNMADVTAWLNENASEYFSSVTYDLASKFITCSTGKNAKLKFGVDFYSGTDPSLIIVLENGFENTSAHGVGKSPGTKISTGKVSYALKTSTGIVLEFADREHSIIITKSNLGTTSLFIEWRGMGIASSSISAEIYESCDLINSTEIFGTNFTENSASTSYSTATNAGRYYWTGDKPSGLTVLVPYCFIGDTYAPDMYLTPFSQYPKQKGVLNCGGVNYYYNGYVALKE